MTDALNDIRRKLSEGKFEFSRHALKRAVERNISFAEIQEAGSAAEIIENYPEDKYSPSVLLLGFTSTQRPLHFQIPLLETEIAKIITLYEPDSEEWIRLRKRR